MSAQNWASERFRSRDSEATAERTFLLWVALYALLVVLLVGHHVAGHSLPMFDGIGHRAQMEPVAGF